MFLSSMNDPNTLLQWGRGISAAEFPEPPENMLVNHSSFNGAAAFQPRNYSRGNHTDGRDTGFNGAAAFQPRNLP